VTQRKEMLAALHLWLHRGNGDRELAAACSGFDWSAPLLASPAERKALRILRHWFYGTSVDLIFACEDFHEAYSDEACRLVDEQVVRLDGRVAFGWADEYELDNVIPLRLKREVPRREEGSQ
jgi:hypothetical protein